MTRHLSLVMMASTSGIMPGYLSGTGEWPSGNLFAVLHITWEWPRWMAGVALPLMWLNVHAKVNWALLEGAQAAKVLATTPLLNTLSLLP